jgi:hypothetical protein
MEDVDVYSKLLVLEDHDIKEEYMEWLNLLANVDVITDALNTCISIEFPENPISPLYVKFALNLQNYFINSEGMRSKIHKKSPAVNPSKKLQALSYIARAVRNKVAHEGVWIATPMKGSIYAKGNFSFYAYPKKELIESLNKQKAGDSYNKGEKISSRRQENLDEKYRLSIELLDNDYKSDHFYISKFMATHYRELVGCILTIYKEKITDNKFQEYGVLRKNAGFRSIEDRLDDITITYQNLCKRL